MSPLVKQTRFPRSSSAGMNPAPLTGQAAGPPARSLRGILSRVVQGFLRLVPALAATGALVFAPAAGPAATSDLELAKGGLNRAVARGWLERADANRYGAIAFRAARAIPRLPGSRASNLAAVLRLVVAQRSQYTRQRALALFSMLDLNTRYLARRWLPRAGTDVYDEDGVLYRSFPGYGLQFHPLGNFARLANLVNAGREEESSWLGQALADRGVPREGTLTWEYYFPFGGGLPPWTSGMAQAAASDALSRVFLHDDARKAFLAVQRGLLVWYADGPWIRLYRFSLLTVLNAQLQAALSIAAYAERAGDEGAASFAVRLRSSALALLPRFDTGFWSRYALGGGEATLHYHLYVTTLMRTLAERTEEPAWAEWYERFERYVTEPPQISALRPTAAVRKRRSARVSFWLSKQSRVTLSIGGGARSISLAHGFHTLTWWPGNRGPGAYRGSLTAVDLAGNRARIQLGPVVVRRP